MGSKKHPSENPQSLMFQGFQGSFRMLGGRGIVHKRFYACSLPGNMILTAIVEGKGIGRCWVVGWLLVVGRDDRGILGGVGIGW